MCSILWSEFTWQAFATLTTGLMATTAAGIVAWRQIVIGHRQVKIAADQAAIATMAQRERLFDRRFDVYLGLKRHFSRAPYLPSDEYVREITSPDLEELLERVRLLFPSEIERSALDLSQHINRIAALRETRSTQTPEIRKDTNRILREEYQSVMDEVASLTSAMAEVTQLHS